jgi:hypothetical protein
LVKLTNKQQLRQALLTVIVIDFLDLLGYLWCYGEGTLSAEGLQTLGGGAVFLLGEQIYALKSS